MHRCRVGNRASAGVRRLGHQSVCGARGAGARGHYRRDDRIGAVRRYPDHHDRAFGDVPQHRHVAAQLGGPMRHPR